MGGPPVVWTTGFFEPGMGFWGNFQGEGITVPAPWSGRGGCGASFFGGRSPGPLFPGLPPGFPGGHRGWRFFPAPNPPRHRPFPPPRVWQIAFKIIAAGSPAPHLPNARGGCPHRGPARGWRGNAPAFWGGGGWGEQ